MTLNSISWKFIPERTRRYFVLSLLVLINLPSYSQQVNPLLKPFYHGVASGDPMAERVIIWTRVTVETTAPVTVDWVMSTDPYLLNVVKSGTTITDASRDYTVKVDVAGLSPGATYYYAFHALGRNSVVGRTKTAPVGSVDNLRFAVVSCSNYQHGYFNGYARISERDDLDGVIHLGDYIYEIGAGPNDYGDQELITSGKRAHVPDKEIVNLDDYRQRYAQYRLDPDLMRAHQQHAFITVWDDHESANDAFEDGAENHTEETEGPWNVRKNVSKQVYEEWMPVRPDVTEGPLYRVISYGNLLDLIMVDTRLEGRDEQIADVTDPALFDPDRTILGTTQRDWLYDQLQNSTAQWKVIGNQIIFSELVVGWAASGELGTPPQIESTFLDIWDGYPVERDNLIDFIGGNNINNVVILTGDFHSSFAFDVAKRPSVFGPDGNPSAQLPGYNPLTGEGSVAVEFATPSITSANFDENLTPQQSAGLEFQFNKPLPADPPFNVNPNPHMKFVDLDRNGYFILDLTPEKVQADWYFVDDILVPVEGESFASGWYTESGENHLKMAQDPAEPAPGKAKPQAGSKKPIFNPARKVDVQLDFLGSVQSGTFDEGAAEIPAYDPVTKRVFVSNGEENKVDVLDILDPENPVKIFSVNIADVIDGEVTSIAVANEMLAVSVNISDKKGKVIFFPTNLSENTAPEAIVEVGYLPDMLVFSPDASFVLVANEAEPSDDGTVDQDGSVTRIDIGSFATKDINFTEFNGKEEALRARGIRIFPGNQVAQDVEPEGIAIAPDGQVALVALQENNAVAVLDLTTNTVSEILPLGLKDHNKGRPELALYTFEEPPLDEANNILFGGLSGLFFEKKVSAGVYQFVTVPDRGPNGDNSEAGRPFLIPSYQAKVIRFQLDTNTGKITIQETILLNRKLPDDTMVPVSGLPNIPGIDEKPIDGMGNELLYDPFGADLEGVVVADDGSFWMCDEYRPSVYHFSASGELIDRFVPEGTAALANPAQTPGTFGTETLPAEYASRRLNRGFEALAFDATEGMLYAFIQTPLANPDRTTSDNSNIIRILGIDPETGMPVAEYVYLLEKPAFGDSSVDKIGDAVFDPSSNKFYVIERDSRANAFNKKFIFEIDLSPATNLLADDAPALMTGKALEQHNADELFGLGIRPVYKQKVLNLPSIGYLPSDKPEGLALLPGGDLAVLNDNDFGLEGPDLATTALGIIHFNPYNNNSLDPSDRDGGINLANWPVLGMYQPDGIASYQVNGSTYYVTANEGDARDYDFFSEEARIGDDEYVLDETAFPEAAALKEDEKLGRLGITLVDGDLDGDGDYDRIHVYGARSFSILDQFGNLVFDSGDELEKVTATLLPENFNANNDDQEIDNRSDNKGPEPEGVAIGVLEGRTYAFVGLERIGGIMVYDITDPANASFVHYTNNRDFMADVESPEAGDLGPEGLVFIPAPDSPSGMPLLVTSNEVSGTTSVFAIGATINPSVTGFTIVDAIKNEALEPLGGILDLANFTTQALSIRIDTDPETVGSVKLELSGPQAFSRVENAFPYALLSDSNGDYVPWLADAGTYTLMATPYEKPEAKGKAGVPATIEFEVINSSTIKKVAVVDATTGNEIEELGNVLDIGMFSSQPVSLLIKTDPEVVGSVMIEITGPDNFTRTENMVPYTLLGDNPNKGSATPWMPQKGTYELTLTPFARNNATGPAGIPLKINFEVTDQSEVTDFVLVDAVTNQDLGPLEEILDLGAYTSTDFNIRAKTMPDVVGSVKFEMSGAISFNRIENLPPYAAFSDQGGDYVSWKPIPGTYTLIATPYSRESAQGTSGMSREISFEVIGQTNAALASRESSSEVTPFGDPTKGVNIFPNPVTDQLTIQLRGAEGEKIAIKIYDVMGRKSLYEEEVTLKETVQNIEVNTASLLPRVYLLKVQSLHLNESTRLVKE